MLFIMSNTSFGISRLLPAAGVAILARLPTINQAFWKRSKARKTRKDREVKNTDASVENVGNGLTSEANTKDHNRTHGPHMV